MAKSSPNGNTRQEILRAALKRGELDSRFGSQELALGFYGQMNVYLMSHLLMPDQPLDRRTAPRIVDLFLAGAASAKARKALAGKLRPSTP